MKKFVLGNNQKKILRSASRDNIVLALHELNPYRKRNLWIGKTNRYREDTINRIYRDTKNGTIHDKELLQYIAVSSVLHCFDGWIFLGRAINALNSGDAHNAHHLAYYAELRAAMSLLASEGIGIFNTQHYVVNKTSNCELIPPYNRINNRNNTGTHIFTWLALEHWAGLTKSNILLQQIISPSGISLQTWFTGFRSGVNSHLLGKEWLTTWGLDLQNISLDHSGRNEVSYRPNYLINQPLLSINETSTFIQYLWELFQPIGTSRFDPLDRYLLRLGLRKIYESITGNSPENDPGGFQSRVQEMVNIVNPQGIPKSEWVKFITKNQSSVILEEASKNEGVTYSNRHHLSVIARSALLLRISSGNVSSILSTAAISKDEISFWWESYANEIGLIIQNNPIENFEDLWSDIEVALSELNIWQQKAIINRSYYTWNHDLARELKILEECERVSLWGIGL